MNFFFRTTKTWHLTQKCDATRLRHTLGPSPSSTSSLPHHVIHNSFSVVSKTQQRIVCVARSLSWSWPWSGSWSWSRSRPCLTLSSCFLFFFNLCVTLALAYCFLCLGMRCLSSSLLFYLWWGRVFVVSSPSSRWFCHSSALLSPFLPAHPLLVASANPLNPSSAR